MREINKENFRPHYIGFVLPESPYDDNKCLNNYSSINLSKCCFIGYGIDCYGKFKDLPHLCFVNQIGVKFSQEVHNVITPEKVENLVPRREAQLTPNTAPSMALTNQSRNTNIDLDSSFMTAVAKSSKILFEQESPA